MKLLAIEASTHEASCALILGDELIERRIDSQLASSETLLPAIQRLMADAGLAFSGLDGIAFGAGPGAFTGVRVAVGITQGLAFAHDLPVAGIETLAAVAFEAITAARRDGLAGASRALAALDARMNEIYYASYRMHKEDLHRVGEIGVANADAVALPCDAPDWLLCGNAASANPVFAARVGALRSVAAATLPRAAAVAALGLQAFRCGAVGPAESALPLYVRDKVAFTVAERLARGGRA